MPYSVACRLPISLNVLRSCLPRSIPIAIVIAGTGSSAAWIFSDIISSNFAGAEQGAASGADVYRCQMKRAQSAWFGLFLPGAAPHPAGLVSPTGPSTAERASQRVTAESQAFPGT